MSCYFCGGSRIASIHSAPDRGVHNWSVGSMTLTRRYDGEPIVRVELFRATAWRTVPDLVSGPARRALVHGRADAPRVTSAQIGETERRARALERDRARALKRSRKAKR